jgi:hypothetical protein
MEEMMPGKRGRQMKRRPCLCCESPERARLDFLIARGESIAVVARKFNLSVYSLHRHAQNHISDEYRNVVTASPLSSLESLQKLACDSGESVLDNLSALYGAYAGRFLTAFEAGDDYKVSKLGLRMESILEMRARISKELLPSGSTFNSITNNVLLADAGQLLKILAPYPEARAAIVDFYSQKTAPRVIEHHADAAD